jgi:hypothetical protein
MHACTYLPSYARFCAAEAQLGYSCWLAASVLSCIPASALHLLHMIIAYLSFLVNTTSSLGQCQHQDVQAHSPLVLLLWDLHAYAPCLQIVQKHSCSHLLARYSTIIHCWHFPDPVLLSSCAAALLQVPAPAALARLPLAPLTRATRASWMTHRWATALC